jgi:hypothetical protein
MTYKNLDGQTRLQTNKYPIMFRKRIRTVNNTCVINAKMVRYFKNHCNVYMYCSHPGCKTFRIKVTLGANNQTIVANVYSSGLNYYHNPDNNGLTNRVKGFQRDLNKVTLKKTKAFSFKADTVDMASPTQLTCGNLQNIKSHDVIRKIRSDSLSADDYDRDDMHDILLMYNDKKNNFLMHVGLPSLHCYSNEQLDILKKLIKTQESVTGYLDATGTLVRKIVKSSKRVLYYALVVNVTLPRNSSVTCPIVEMISSNHDIVAISQWLNAFKAFVLKNKMTWPVFTNIVIDFSYAQMNALSIGMNGFTSIFDYLNWCYRELVGNNNGSKVTIINICTNHYTKIIVNHVYTYFQSDTNNHKTVEKSKRNKIIDWICILFNAMSLVDIENWFTLFSVILLSPYNTEQTKYAIFVMGSKCNIDYQLPEEDKHSLDDVNEFLCESNSSNSMMYCRFQSIKEKVKSSVLQYSLNIGEDISTNEYFDEPYLQEFIVKCVPFIALWTPIMNNKLKNGIEIRQSNATVESWFKTVKIDILQGDRRLKCSRFLKLMRNRLLNVHKQIKYKIRNNNCTRVLNFDNKSKQQNTTKENVITKIPELSRHNHLDATESWGKKEKQHKHLQPTKYRPFKALSSKIPSLLSPTVIENIGALQCDTATRYSVDGSLNNKIQDEIIEQNENDLSKSLDKNDPMKSVSTPGSHKSPFQRAVQSKDFHENKLPKDLEYYKRIKMPKNKDYLVGKYYYISREQNSDFMAELNFLDFDTLSGNNWLCNFVIDTCLLTYAFKLNLKNTHILSCNSVTQLMDRKEIGEESYKKITFPTNSMVILPWLFNNSHWIVVFINFNTRECYIMDPNIPYDIDSRKSKICFNQLLKALKSNVIYGVEKNCPSVTHIACPLKNIPKQKDTFNCGVFIVYYAFTIMNGSNFNSEFDPNMYRKYLKSHLLENSEDMTNICLYCSSDTNKHRPHPDDEGVDWVSCSLCCRWMAINCIPTEDRMINYEVNDFFCILCRK